MRMRDVMKYRIIEQNTKSSWDLYGDIDDHEQYEELITQLRNANENDMMILKINSPGGRADVGFMIVKAIQTSPATVLAHVVWPSASMASIIALSCDGMVMDDYTHLMFHAYTGGSYGKADDLVQDVNETHWSLDNNARRIVSPFLSKKEIEKMSDGKDIYIRSNDPALDKRIKRHFRIIA